MFHETIVCVQKLDGGISDFRISGQSLILGNCHNSRTVMILTKNLDQLLNLAKETKQCQKNLSITLC